MQYPHGTILNSNSDSTYKKLPENIYFFGVPNILPEPDPGRLCRSSLPLSSYSKLIRFQMKSYDSQNF